MIRLASLAIALLFVGCAVTQTTGGPRATAPDDTFSCYMRVLAEMEYRLENTDRGSGFILAVKEDGTGDLVNEATVTIIPASGGGSDVSVTMRSIRASSLSMPSVPNVIRRASPAAVEPATPGMTLTGEAEEDLDALSEACVS